MAHLSDQAQAHSVVGVSEEREDHARRIDSQRHELPAQRRPASRSARTEAASGSSLVTRVRTASIWSTASCFVGRWASATTWSRMQACRTALPAGPCGGVLHTDRRESPAPGSSPWRNGAYDIRTNACRKAAGTAEPRTAERPVSCPRSGAIASRHRPGPGSGGRRPAAPSQGRVPAPAPSPLAGTTPGPDPRPAALIRQIQPNHPNPVPRPAGPTLPVPRPWPGGAAAERPGPGGLAERHALKCGNSRVPGRVRPGPSGQIRHFSSLDLVPVRLDLLGARDHYVAEHVRMPTHQLGHDTVGSVN
jgi:hypothetical protein